MIFFHNMIILVIAVIIFFHQTQKQHIFKKSIKTERKFNFKQR